MATTKGQRIGIWVIAIALTAGTLGGFLVMVLAPKNQASDQERLKTLSAEYSKQYEAYQSKVATRDEKIAKELSGKYYNSFKQYESRVTPFDASAVKELGKEDVAQGDGSEVSSESQYAVYYIGWNPSGKMFDSSFNADKTALKQPLEHQSDGTWLFPGGQTGGVIEGWTKGVEGMKIGGGRELTIPSDLAYKDQAQGDDIPANTPLKFIIMVVPAPDKGEEISPPKMSAELQQLYSRIYKVDPSALGGQ